MYIGDILYGPGNVLSSICHGDCRKGSNKECTGLGRGVGQVEVDGTRRSGWGRCELIGQLEGGGVGISGQCKQK